MKLSLKSIFGRVGFSYSWRIAILLIVKKILRLDEFKFYFSQFGEDITLLDLIKSKPKGLYIDVGCNEPIRYNNTFYFYLRGWQGINIDANKSLINKFNIVRPKDINLFTVISDEEREVNYYMSNNNPEVNTIDFNTYKKWKEIWNFDKIETLKTQKLSDIISKYIEPKQEIDFLSIDVEGHDFNVLKSIDFTKCRPKLILIEIHNIDLTSFAKHPIYVYLDNLNYSFVGFSTLNAYFKDNSKNSNDSDEI